MNHDKKSVLFWGSIVVLIFVLLSLIEPREQEDGEDSDEYIDYLERYRDRHRIAYVLIFISILGMMWALAYVDEGDKHPIKHKATGGNKPDESHFPKQEYEETIHDSYSVKRFKVDENRPR